MRVLRSSRRRVVMVAMGKAITKMRYMGQMKRMLCVRRSERKNLHANVERVAEVGELTGEEGEDGRVMRLGLRDDAINESLERNEKRAQRRGFGIGLLLVGFHIRLPVCDEQIVGSDVEVILDRTRVRRQELGEVLKLDGHADAGLQIQGSDVRFLLETQHRYIQGDFGKGLRKRLDKRSNNGVLDVIVED